MLIDTHSHIYDSAFDADRDAFVSRAKEAGVERLLLPAIDKESYQAQFDACKKYGDYLVPMIGLHPTSINDNPLWRQDLEMVKNYLDNPLEGVKRWCGVGEIGLDFYWSKEFINQQVEGFTTQIEWAIEYHLPIAVHIRNGWDNLIEIIKRYKGSGLTGVFHAFSSSIETYTELKKCGDFAFGIGGVVTFKNSKLAAVVAQIPLTDIVLETDCPYLTPAPYRGQRNESSYIHYICTKVAEIKQLPYDQVANTTTNTASRIFQL